MSCLSFLYALSGFLAVQGVGGFRRQRLWILVPGILEATPVLVGTLYSFSSIVFGVGFTSVATCDILLSLTTTITSLATSGCLTSSAYRKVTNQCSASQNLAVAMLAVIPAVIGIGQCTRRALTEKPASTHIYNGVKYGLSVVSSSLLSIYLVDTSGDDARLRWGYFAAAMTSYIYCGYWDVREGWEQAQHRFRLLRETPMFHRHACSAGVLMNLFLRLTFVSTLLWTKGKPYGALVSFGTCTAEIIRRGMWLGFTVEREHVSNSEKKAAEIIVLRETSECFAVGDSA